MYLSKLLLNPYSPNVRRDLSDVHDLHRTIMRAFPQKSDTTPEHQAREEFGVLHRVEINRSHPNIVLLVQSKAVPDWTLLPKDYFLKAPHPTTDVKDLQGVYEALRPGLVLQFRLRANPTKKRFDRTHNDPLDGKRVALFKPEDQIKWLQRKAAESGFEIVESKIQPKLSSVLSKPEGNFIGYRPRPVGDQQSPAVQGRSNRSSKTQMAFTGVLFEGILRVIDCDKFRHTLQTGIGSGKAYGFGLLSIAPLQPPTQYFQ